MTGNLILSDQLYDQFEAILTDLHARTRAEFILLVDLEGRLISTRGHTEEVDPELMASLVVADVIAATELSRQIGGGDTGTTLLHEGKRINVYLFNIADQLVLGILFRSGALVNVIHAQSRYAIDQLRRLANGIRGPGGQADSQSGPPQTGSQEREGQNVPSGLSKAGPTLPDVLARQVEHTLANLRNLTKAECVLLADVSGQLLSVNGEIQGVDPTLMAMLAAADIVATNELVERIGGKDQGGASLRRGKLIDVYLFDVSRRFVLVVLMQRSQMAALVHTFGSRAAERLCPIADEFERWLQESTELPDAEFGHTLSEEMDKAFKGL